MKKPRLCLNAQTIRHLQTDDLRMIVGGVSRAQPGCATLDAECKNTASCNTTCPVYSEGVSCRCVPNGIPNLG